MKPLKSGIQLDPENLKNSKGGACACGCDVYMPSTLSSAGGEESEICNCACWGTIDPLSSEHVGVAKYIW